MYLWFQFFSPKVISHFLLFVTKAFLDQCSSRVIWRIFGDMNYFCAQFYFAIGKTCAR